jgi:DNA-binding GntR family transcriptional regulator
VRNLGDRHEHHSVHRRADRREGERAAQAMLKSLNQVIRDYLVQFAGQDQAERDAE